MQEDPSRSRAEVEQFSSFLEAVPAAALLLDVAGRVRFVNRLAEDYLGRSRCDLCGQELLWEVLTEGDARSISSEYRSLLDRPHPAETRWDTTIHDSSGARPVSLAVRSHEIAADRWAVVLIEDRSALSQETERRRRAERLAAVGEVAAGVAHEVNNPLASIKGFAQLLSRETLDRGQHQALEIISGECDRVARVIDNLLGFSSQQEIVQHELVDVSSVVEDMVNLKRYALETSGVRIETELDPLVSPVRAEKGALQRLILILLHHAERSLTRQSGDKRLRVRTRETNEGAVVHVTESCADSSRDDPASLLDSADDHDRGLTLASADSLAREMGGSFSIESRVGSGTTFTVRLRGAAGPSGPEAARVRRALGSVPDISGVRVLVVDDEPTFRLALATFLGRHGSGVDQAEDAEQGLKMFASRGYDVVFVGVRDSGDGLALLARLDDLPDWHGHAILMTEDHTPPRIREELRGGRPHLIKPFDMLDAVRMVESVRHEPRFVRPPGIATWTSSLPDNRFSI